MFGQPARASFFGRGGWRIDSPVPPRRKRMISERMLTAISSGVSALSSRPIGEWIRSTPARGPPPPAPPGSDDPDISSRAIQERRDTFDVHAHAAGGEHKVGDGVDPD